MAAYNDDQPRVQQDRNLWGETTGNYNRGLDESFHLLIFLNKADAATATTVTDRAYSAARTAGLTDSDPVAPN